MANYRIPKEITSELKINKMIYLLDLFIIMGMLIGSMVFGNMVYSSLKPFFYIFMGCVGLIFILRTYTNPKKRMYQAISIAITRRRDTYCSIDYPERNE